MNGTRWRLQWWLVGNEREIHARWYTSPCKLCAAKRAYQFARALAKVKYAPDGAIRWQVMRYNLHSNRPVVVASSSSIGIGLLNVHSH